MNDREFQCEITQRDQNRITVKVNGVEYRFSLESIFSYLRQNLLDKGGNIENGNNIKSQMPGKIVDLFMSEGDLVNEGEAILSLEAMKMQNEIMAPGDGKVADVRVAAGQSVNTGDVMVVLG